VPFNIKQERLDQLRREVALLEKELAEEAVIVEANRVAREEADRKRDRRFPPNDPADQSDERMAKLNPDRVRPSEKNIRAERNAPAPKRCASCSKKNCSHI
jgi:hypothetical protein